jgi:low affinity Fe/Cu permease
VKLDELIRVSKAQNSFIGLEHLTEEELEEIRRRCEEAAKAEVAAGRMPADYKKSNSSLSKQTTNN